MPTVRVLRPFANDHHDRIVHPGDHIEIDADRARDLVGNGLVEHAETPPAVPLPANKMAPAPATRRPRGRR